MCCYTYQLLNVLLCRLELLVWATHRAELDAFNAWCLTCTFFFLEFEVLSCKFSLLLGISFELIDWCATRTPQLSVYILAVCNVDLYSFSIYATTCLLPEYGLVSKLGILFASSWRASLF